jgi:hypothetical protein
VAREEATTMHRFPLTLVDRLSDAAKRSAALSTGWLLCVCLAVDPIGGSGTDAAELAWLDVTVRVYHTGILADGSVARALDLAQRALGPADLRLHWVRCHGAGEPTCARPLARGDIALRLVRAGQLIHRAREIPLGDTMVDTAREAAVLATVYLDRVERLAAAGGADASTLLGRAIAHELAHAVAGSRDHAPWGLMRARWSTREVAQDLRRDWRLRQEDRDRLRARRRAHTFATGD